jgi:enoyl-CoA hydratase
MAIRLETADDGIWTLWLSQPSRLNALDDDTVLALRQTLGELAHHSACRVLILSGEGRGFCAGFDLSLAGDAPGSAEDGETEAWMARQEQFASIVLKLRELRQPVIAAVNGPANGAGLGLALAADIRIASTSASFNAAFIKVGMSGCDIGVSYLLPRCIGASMAFDLMLSGRMVQADEALRIGLVSRLVTADELMAQARALAAELVAHDRFALWMTKRGMWANLEAPSLHAAIELENRTQILARSTGALARAAQAMLANKKPV